VQINEQSLDKNPVPLDIDMWKMREYQLCRTPAEERQHLFEAARNVYIPKTNFAAHVYRILRCLLQSSPLTSNMKLAFIDGQNLDIDAGFLAPTWKIRKKWLTAKGTHENVYCEEDRSDEQNMFSCDHVVMDLWDIIISQLTTAGEHPLVSTQEAWLKGIVGVR
jgi:hypothetical protein